MLCSVHLSCENVVLSSPEFLHEEGDRVGSEVGVVREARRQPGGEVGAGDVVAGILREQFWSFPFPLQ